ncbi:MAG: sulfotransferase [Haliea sp.]|uniref:tetratricopeptide repeat-containing sulfotransferase family protein n=1 Tax=Haliea sp. TaxID=1932666 RepID=UPI0032EFA5B3
MTYSMSTCAPDSPAPADSEPRARPSSNQVLQRLGRLRGPAQAREALPLLPQLAQEYPGDHRLLRAISEIALRAGDVAQATEYAKAAIKPEIPGAGQYLHLAICLIAAGEERDACTALLDAEAHAMVDADSAAMLASLYVKVNEHERALRGYQQAIELDPRNAKHHFSRAATLRFLGRLEEAEQACDSALEIDPGEYEAYLIRSDLRTQTAHSNHIEDMEQALERVGAPYMGEVMLCHALAKECEDIGEHARSFRYLARGAGLRRKHLSYDVRQDLELIDELMEHFSPERLNPARAGGFDSPLPVFVLGMPRTGTTLVERILASHSGVSSAGEPPDFPRVMAALAERQTPGSAGDPKALIAASLDLDMEQLGRQYVDSLARRVDGGLRVIDKLPFNYLNVGLLHLALPQATIIHVTRDPVDTCYAVYKTLFQRAYPFSYDLEDLGRYFIAYSRLMDHWHRCLPGKICRVSYEALVEAPERESGRLIEACGLQWEDGMRAFHNNPSPSMTASASQVRRPIYRSSVGKWHNYASELEPLLRLLRDAGLTSES